MAENRRFSEVTSGCTTLIPTIDFDSAVPAKMCGIRLRRVVKVGIHHLTKAADWTTLSWFSVPFEMLDNKLKTPNMVR